MPTLTPTYETGATSMPIGMVTVEPAHAMTENVLASSVELEGLNVPFVLGTLSEMLTHERCGRHLYRSVARRTNNPMLKRKYEQFGQETERHAELLEGLIAAMGADPMYVSPAARALDKSDSGLLESTFLLAGSVDPMTAEAVMLTAVFLAESLDHANWQLLSSLVPELPAGEIRDLAQRVTAEVEAQEDDHLTWAHDTRARLATMQAKSSFVAGVGMKAEEMLARVKSMFD